MESMNTIDDVLLALDHIIEESQENQNPLGYFAALYRMVTQKVKDGIADGYFEDGHRMERLDVIFASRYIDAYHEYHSDQKPTESWIKAFDLSKKYWPIVLQHLLIGMNAHINLDLGIAAAEVMKGRDIQDLKGDFDKINEVLASLVGEVEKDLSDIWPTLAKILKWTQKLDTFLINFSMELARDGAWNFAVGLSETAENYFEEMINTRDQKVANMAKLITNPGWMASLVFRIIRLGERGTVAEKIQKLKE
jgi:hypothetical protein